MEHMNEKITHTILHRVRMKIVFLETLLALTEFFSRVNKEVK